MEWWAEIARTKPRSEHEDRVLIDEISEAGFTHVKIPLRGPRWAPGARADEAALRRCWLSPRRVEALAHHAADLGLGTVVSVHYRGDVGDAAQIASDLKLGSYELLDTVLVRTAARCSRRLTLSTGGSRPAEVAAAAEAAAAAKDLALLYTVPLYPTPLAAVDLGAISALRREPGASAVGYSDHTHNEMIVRLAAAAGAEIIEMHVALRSPEPWEWTPAFAGAAIQCVARDRAADSAPRIAHERLWRADPGDGKRPLWVVR